MQKILFSGYVDNIMKTNIKIYPAIIRANKSAINFTLCLYNAKILTNNHLIKRQYNEITMVQKIAQLMKGNNKNANYYGVYVDLEANGEATLIVTQSDCGKTKHVVIKNIIKVRSDEGENNCVNMARKKAYELLSEKKKQGFKSVDDALLDARSIALIKSNFDYREDATIVGFEQTTELHWVCKTNYGKRVLCKVQPYVDLTSAFVYFGRKIRMSCKRTPTGSVTLCALQFVDHS